MRHKCANLRAYARHSELHRRESSEVPLGERDVRYRVVAIERRLGGDEGGGEAHGHVGDARGRDDAQALARHLANGGALRVEERERTVFDALQKVLDCVCGHTLCVEVV